MNERMLSLVLHINDGSIRGPTTPTQQNLLTEIKTDKLSPAPTKKGDTGLSRSIARRTEKDMHKGIFFAQ